MGTQKLEAVAARLMLPVLVLEEAKVEVMVLVVYMSVLCDALEEEMASIVGHILSFLRSAAQEADNCRHA